MLRAALCDDNQIFLEEMKRLLEQDGRVDSLKLYSDPETLCEDIVRQRQRFDVVFLDIDLGEDRNGIHYAKRLYHLAPELAVIYVTGYNDRYAQHVLLEETNLLGYMTKPVEEQILAQYINKVYDRKNVKEILTFTVRGRDISILTEDIMYMESRNHTVTVYTDRESYTTYEKLSEVGKRLPQNFIQCHKSFLVNLDKVHQLMPDGLVLSSGQPVPVSKTYQAGTRASFFHHIGQKVQGVRDS